MPLRCPGPVEHARRHHQQEHRKQAPEGRFGKPQCHLGACQTPQHPTGAGSDRDVPDDTARPGMDRGADQDGGKDHGERRALGDLLFETQQGDQRRHEHDSAPDTECGGQNPGQQPDRNQARRLGDP